MTWPEQAVEPHLGKISKILAQNLIGLTQFAVLAFQLPDFLPVREIASLQTYWLVQAYPFWRRFKVNIQLWGNLHFCRPTQGMVLLFLPTWKRCRFGGLLIDANTP